MACTEVALTPYSDLPVNMHIATLSFTSVAYLRRVAQEMGSITWPVA
jgi:hypothetical protein